MNERSRRPDDQSKEFGCVSAQDLAPVILVQMSMKANGIRLRHVEWIVGAEA